MPQCWEHWKGFHFIAHSEVLNLFLYPLCVSAMGRAMLASKTFSELEDCWQDVDKSRNETDGPSRGDGHLSWAWYEHKGWNAHSPTSLNSWWQLDMGNAQDIYCGFTCRPWQTPS